MSARAGMSMPFLIGLRIRFHNLLATRLHCIVRAHPLHVNLTLKTRVWTSLSATEGSLLLFLRSNMRRMLSIGLSWPSISKICRRAPGGWHILRPGGPCGCQGVAPSRSNSTWEVICWSTLGAERMNLALLKKLRELVGCPKDSSSCFKKLKMCPSCTGAEKNSAQRLQKSKIVSCKSRSVHDSPATAWSGRA